MNFLISRQHREKIRIAPDFRAVGASFLIGSTQWTGSNGETHERFQVLRFRDGKIVDMQDCPTLSKAERYVRRHD